jgi:hypothetical protein
LQVLREEQGTLSASVKSLERSDSKGDEIDRV